MKLLSHVFVRKCSSPWTACSAKSLLAHWIIIACSHVPFFSDITVDTSPSVVTYDSTGGYTMLRVVWIAQYLYCTNKAMSYSTNVIIYYADMHKIE